MSEYNDPAIVRMLAALRSRSLEPLIQSVRNAYPDLPDVAIGHLISIAMNLVMKDAYLASSQLCTSQDMIDALPDVHRQAILKMGEAVELIGLAIQEAILSGVALDAENETVQLMREKVDELNAALGAADQAKRDGLRNTPYAELLGE